VKKILRNLGGQAQQKGCRAGGGGGGGIAIRGALMRTKIPLKDKPVEQVSTFE
jgi:hypothetical protein